ncbi:hypothetical protein GGQ84_002272 [Desulfitispora alkaliphila]|uniref:Spo0B domain-containing protein n=1 Tax=Desulfitispora alkaliphila TaxID=622674 RepID=UPI003D1BCAD3
MKDSKLTKLELEDIVYLMRVQKHDILNYLQVISGFIQLRKVDEAERYLKQAMTEVQDNGQVLKVQNPYIVITLLHFQEQFNKKGFKLNIEVDSQEIEEVDYKEENADKLFKSFQVILQEDWEFESKFTVGLEPKGNKYRVQLEMPMNCQGCEQEQQVLRKLSEICSYDVTTDSSETKIVWII